jgi:hypothetical protein
MNKQPPLSLIVGGIPVQAASAAWGSVWGAPSPGFISSGPLPLHSLDLSGSEVTCLGVMSVACVAFRHSAQVPAAVEAAKMASGLVAEPCRPAFGVNVCLQGCLLVGTCRLNVGTCA